MVDWSMDTGVGLPALIPVLSPRELLSPSLSFLTCRMETVVTHLIHRKLVDPGICPLARSLVQVKFGLGISEGNCDLSWILEHFLNVCALANTD